MSGKLQAGRARRALAAATGSVLLVGFVLTALRADERAAVPSRAAVSSVASPAVREAPEAAEIDRLMDLHRLDPAAGHDRAAFEISDRLRAGASGETASLAAIQRELDPGTVLVEYFLGARKSYAWAVTRDGIESADLPARGVIEAAAQRAFGALSSRNRVAQASSGPLGQNLGAALLEPLQGTIHGKTLIIVPDRALRELPFAALPDPDQIERPLVEDHEIVVVSSASELVALRRRAESRPRPARLAAVFADPVFAPSDPRRSISGARGVSGLTGFPRLPFAEEEAETILRLAGNRGKGFLGLDAGLDAVRNSELSDFRILHFATHGVPDRTAPGLLLSTVDTRGKARDGLLTAAEIERLSLRADLVVLSACGTGSGQTLVRSFFRAGAQRVVSSLWSVDDRTTAALMERFYEGMLVRNLAPAAALREAQLWVRAQPRWSAPADWAGFVLQGDWR